jgi:putative ATP-dependent endonuclease of the OLD family
MYLRLIEIKNYRSLAHVELHKLDRFNVLIGRNNSGKSSVFGVLILLNNVFWGNNVDWGTVVTGNDLSLPLEIRLVFEPRPQSRYEFIELLINAGQAQNRRAALLDSPLLRQIEFSFRKSPGSSQLLHLRETKILAEDGHWAIAQRMKDGQEVTNPRSDIVDIGAVAGDTESILASNLLHVDTSPHLGHLDFYVSLGRQAPSYSNLVSIWPQKKLVEFFSEAFFFNPFRHSEGRLQVHETKQLVQDGRNLAQVLHTINSNDRPRFALIDDFLQSALPGVGMLQTPLIENHTEVSFRATNGKYLVRLHDMGGGIEQLLMIATVLLTTGDESSLFVEEPESHLHPGAQRLLAEKLCDGDRQVFITTHSPVFVNMARPKSIYRVNQDSGRTKIDRLNNAGFLSEVLEDIGSRNSDVFLSDAVLFVEGRSDQQALSVWSKTLNLSLDGHNVTLLPMDGGEYAERKTRVRSDTLVGISQKAPVPHMFLLDHDERSEAEINKLRESLGERLYVLHRRELENYLLIPRAILVAIRSKCPDNHSIIDKLNSTSVENVNQLIRELADGLYGVVLLKRIRAELGGLVGGLLPRNLAMELASEAKSQGLEKILRERIEIHAANQLAGLDIEGVVSRQREILEKEWSDSGLHLALAPGGDILESVFRYFGTEYKKPEDTVRIAKEMTEQEIPDEIKDLITTALALTNYVHGGTV